MDIQQSTLVFRLSEGHSLSELNIPAGTKHFIADLSGISEDLATNIRNKFITFDKTISELKGSFVIVCDFSFDDSLTIVPTLQEAFDYIEMEEIERQLEL